MGSVISLPFSFNISGSVNTTAEEGKIWSDRVMGVIFTKPLDRVMRPSFGSLASTAVFETEGSLTQYVTRAVTAAFSEFLPELELINISITKESGELGTEGFVISVDYELPNKQQETVAAKIGEFTRSGDLIQEIQ
jgi:phage baseplate assembly protein W